MVKVAKNQHVVRHEKGWNVRRAGNERATGVFGTQAEELDARRRVDQNEG